MRLSSVLNSALNEQILKEYHNMLLYRQIESYFQDFQLKGLAGYFAKQAEEEKGHALKFIDYINDRIGGKVALGDVDAPNAALTDFSSVGDEYVKTEEATTESIEALYDLALGEKSYMDLGFLEEMLNEQVSEEDEAAEFSLKIKSVKDIVLFDETFNE
jgi:ferritin